MAPIEKRKLEAEDEEAKRARVEGESEGESQESGSDESDFDEEEFDGPDGDLSMEDFADVENFTEEMLEKYKEAFGDFIDELTDQASKDNREPKLLENPVSLRPVPQTKEEFMTRICWTTLSAEAVKKKDEIHEALLSAEAMPDAEVDEDITEERINELIKTGSKDQMAVFEKEISALETSIKEKETNWNFALEVSLVLMDTLFDDDDIMHYLFTESADCSEEVIALLGRFAAVWKQILAEPLESLKVEEKTLKGVRAFITSCVNDLHNGEFSGSKEEENKFATVKFDF